MKEINVGDYTSLSLDDVDLDTDFIGCLEGGCKKILRKVRTGNLYSLDNGSSYISLSYSHEIIDELKGAEYVFKFKKEEDLIKWKYFESFLNPDSYVLVDKNKSHKFSNSFIGIENDQDEKHYMVAIFTDREDRIFVVRGQDSFSARGPFDSVKECLESYTHSDTHKFYEFDSRSKLYQWLSE